MCKNFCNAKVADSKADKKPTASRLAALLLNCRTPQSCCTAPGQSCWHHYWVHLDGAGVAALEAMPAFEQPPEPSAQQKSCRTAMCGSF